jgi:dihydrofolate synthase / folylpolyglutamate synthase
MTTNLKEFLDNKSLYYDKIDYDVIKLSWEILSSYVCLPYIIHIVGTNGKGSTGRFLASILTQLNQKVLHYSSPHILTFNERIWIDGHNISNDILDSTHKRLQDILPDNLLEIVTYFEYATLLALYLSDKKDYLVLEAGLGGEFDATNVVKNDLTIFTTIGLDHQSFLGNNVSQIARTKMRSCDSAFILAHQIYDEIETVKNEILFDKKEIPRKIYKLNEETLLLPLYLQNNVQVALRVLEYLGFIDINYTLPKLSGRFEKLESNIIVDVGHNPLAALSIANELKNKEQKYILIYNSLGDKDYKEVLNILKPYISEIQIISCSGKRVVEKNLLLQVIKNLEIKVYDFDIVNMKEENHYLVFGSFLVVEKFMEEYNHNYANN